MQPEAQIEYGFDQRKLQDLKENLLNVKVRIYVRIQGVPKESNEQNSSETV